MTRSYQIAFASCVLMLLTLVADLGDRSAMAEDADSTFVANLFDARYQIFADTFRESPDTQTRLQLTKEAGKDLNQILQEHLTSDAIVKLLPKLEKVRIVKLDTSFIKIIDAHPKRDTRARALLSFAKYAGNNERLKTCKATLDYLSQQYGHLKFQEGRSYADEADEAKYFYTHLAVGAKAPAMVGEDADGAVFRLDDYRGKVVVLRFWGDWCPACRAMYPYERKLVEKFKNQPFALIGVNSDSLERCKKSQRESDLMWRTVWDGGTTNGPVATVFRVHNWPTIVVIDADGVIKYRAEGLDERKLDRVLERCIQSAMQAT